MQVIFYLKDDKESDFQESSTAHEKTLTLYKNCSQILEARFEVKFEISFQQACSITFGFTGSQTVSKF